MIMIALLLGCRPPAEGAAADTGQPSLEVQTLSDDSPYTSHFDRYIDVFGVRLLAAPDVPDDKITHAATITAEYLDNDEDGIADDPPVVTALSEERAVILMFANADAMEGSGLFWQGWMNDVFAQDLAADETAPEGEFDASYEEVLHLIQTAGWAQVYAEVGTEEGTELAEAMDIARGGHFESIPEPYPSAAWYHYDDTTCDYECMATEYFYWAMTSLLGVQAGRCGEIDDEWELCTADDVRGTDTAITALLEGGAVPLPTVAPDGVYTP